MLSRSAYYALWVARWLIAVGVALLAGIARMRYFPRVPSVVVEVPLFVVLIMTLIRGPMSYAAYVRDGAKRAPAKTQGG